MNVNVSIYRWFHELDLFADLLMIVILDVTDTSMIFRIMPCSHSISGPIHFRPKNEVEPQFSSWLSNLLANYLCYMARVDRVHCTQEMNSVTERSLLTYGQPRHSDTDTHA